MLCSLSILDTENMNNSLKQIVQKASQHSNDDLICCNKLGNMPCNLSILCVIFKNVVS